LARLISSFSLPFLFYFQIQRTFVPPPLALLSRASAAVVVGGGGGGDIAAVR
jgi:hypothetical protein